MTQDLVTVRLAYGEHGLDVDLPRDRTTVVEPALHADGHQPARRPPGGPAPAGRRTASA